MAFFELSFDAVDFQNCGFDARDELEDPLDEALQNAKIGEVTGGGSGRGRTNIDIETFDDVSDEDALAIIRSVLIKLGAPRSSMLTRTQPVKQQWPIFE
jgi:hypothetical protein